MDPQMPVKLEATVSGALMTAPLWTIWLTEISHIASAVAAICGAIVGLHTVWRLWRRRHDRDKN